METSKNSVCGDHLFDLSHPGGTLILASVSVAASVSLFLLALQTSVSLLLNFTGPMLTIQNSFVHLHPCFRLLYIMDQNKL